jgi:CRP-like cAMP-binding protein
MNTSNQPKLEVRQLRALPALRDFTDDDLAILLSIGHARQLAPTEVLFRKGASGTSCFLVVEGTLTVHREEAPAPGGAVAVGPGSFVGQLALVDQRPRGATVVAKSAAILLEVTRDTFERLLHAVSPLALRFQHQIAVAGVRQHRSTLARLFALADERAKGEAARRAHRGAANQDAVTATDPARPAASRSKRDDDRDRALAYIQAATREWGMPLDDVRAVPAADAAPRTVPKRG